MPRLGATYRTRVLRTCARPEVDFLSFTLATTASTSFIIVHLLNNASELSRLIEMLLSSSKSRPTSAMLAILLPSHQPTHDIEKMAIHRSGSNTYKPQDRRHC
jgi:hypothetical protein